MKINYLTKEEIININKELVKKSGDPHSVIHIGNLEGNLESMKLKYSSKPERELIIWKAAFWLHRMAKSGHVFVEGNKRTALMTTLLFLSQNSCYLRRINKKEQLKIPRLIKNIASGSKSLTWVASWLDEHLLVLTEHNIESELIKLVKELKEIKHNLKQRDSYKPKKGRYIGVTSKYTEKFSLIEAKILAFRTIKKLNIKNKK